MKNVKRTLISCILATAMLLPFAPLSQDAGDSTEKDMRKKTICFIDSTEKCKKPGNECEFGDIKDNCNNPKAWRDLGLKLGEIALDIIKVI